MQQGRRVAPCRAPIKRKFHEIPVIPCNLAELSLWAGCAKLPDSGGFASMAG